ncbi:hypothetical protein F3Y22_tig00110429pilonHSYRG00635 [Hibiscus syriacus]|uniref:Cullin N-terminal domain-containing protein n=1 Tax=Hibiscus syriacus TaxID=106335 RepID=A0A6A3AN93_HIBSY|nr:hypothetical protein F3Y22_tig00110429pilonHSYRG00635 [Hibiscus syriacus]
MAEMMRNDQTSPDIQTELLLSFSEAAKGCTKDLCFDAFVPCDSCDGCGYPPNAKVKVCPICGGKGNVTDDSVFSRDGAYVYFNSNISLTQIEDFGLSKNAYVKLVILKMFTALGIYSESFEKPFLECTSEFYAVERMKYMQQSDVLDYLKHVEEKGHRKEYTDDDIDDIHKEWLNKEETKDNVMEVRDSKKEKQPKNRSKLRPKGGISKKEKFQRKYFNYGKMGHKSFKCRHLKIVKARKANVMERITKNVEDIDLRVVISEVKLVGFNAREWEKLYIGNVANFEIKGKGTTILKITSSKEIKL